MQVSAAETGSPVPEFPLRLALPGAISTLPTTAAPLHDSVAIQPGLLEAHRLIGHLTEAVALGDMPRATAALTEFIHHNPEHAVSLVMNQAPVTIQPELQELVHRVTTDARLDAVRVVDAAQATVAAAAWHPHGLDSTEVLAVAQRFIESGQLANYIRAAELGQMVMARYKTAPRVRPRRRFVAKMWRRAPMLVLLLAWLTAGVVGFALSFLLRLSAGSVDTGFGVWAVGFLVLVGLQFIIKTARANRG